MTAETRRECAVISQVLAPVCWGFAVPLGAMSACAHQQAPTSMRGVGEAPTEMGNATWVEAPPQRV